MFCGSALLEVLVCGRLWELEVRGLVAQVSIGVCMLQTCGGLWGCCCQGDCGFGGRDKVAPSLSSASVTELQVALLCYCKPLSR